MTQPCHVCHGVGHLAVAKDTTIECPNCFGTKKEPTP